MILFPDMAVDIRRDRTIARIF